MGILATVGLGGGVDGWRLDEMGGRTGTGVGTGMTTTRDVH